MAKGPVRHLFLTRRPRPRCCHRFRSARNAQRSWKQSRRRMVGASCLPRSERVGLGSHRSSRGKHQPAYRADDVLDRTAANRVAQLRVVVTGASVVDAAVAVAAERAGSDGGVVEVLTSDVADLRDLAANIRATVDVVHL